MSRNSQTFFFIEKFQSLKLDLFDKCLKITRDDFVFSFGHIYQYIGTWFPLGFDLGLD